jgi:uncharacterized delta-60 repeat protein
MLSPSLRLFFVFLLIIVSRLAAADGNADDFFAGGSIAGHHSGAAPVVRAIAVQSDSKVIVGGDYTLFNGIPRGGLARLHPDGSLDASFAANVSGGNATIEAICIQPDGKILIAGDFKKVGTASRVGIARLMTDGSLDPGFHARGPRGEGAAGKIAALALQSDGRILVAGSFTTFNGEARGRVARLNADGSLDTRFGPGRSGANLYVSDLALQIDGKILIGGYFTAVDNIRRARIARLNADGSLDESFGYFKSGAVGNVVTLALQSDGKVLIGGDFTSVNSVKRGRVARLNSDGSLDTAFRVLPSGFDREVRDILVQADGRVLVAGAFSQVMGQRRGGVARLQADGRLDDSFLAAQSPSAGANALVRAISMQADGRILVGGDFTVFNGLPRSRLARLGRSGVFIDTEPPVIALIGSNPLRVLLNASFVDPGALLKDNVDPLRTIYGTGAVDTSKLGNYSISYSASDAGGNFALPVRRVVSVVSSSPDSWDFRYESRHVNDATADSYLHSAINSRKYSEWQSPPVTYWGPNSTGESTLTFRFPFAAPARQISLRAGIASFNFGSGTGSSSLYGSTDGQSWVLLKNNPAPTGRLDSYVNFEGDLPTQLLGARQLWLQVRMRVQGSINPSYALAQFSRSAASAAQPVFAVYARYGAANASRLAYTSVSHSGALQQSEAVLSGVPAIDSIRVVPEISTLKSGEKRKMALILANNATYAVSGNLRLESSRPDLVSVPREVPFTVPGKRTATSPPKLVRIKVPVSAVFEGLGQATITARFSQTSGEAVIASERSSTRKIGFAFD